MEIPPEVYAKACAKKVLKLVNLLILRRGGPIVTIEQPPRSPDTNVNDLAFFNSLGAKVSKKTKTFDEEELAQIVEDEYNNYPEEKLCDLWKLKRELLHLIFADDGVASYSS